MTELIIKKTVANEEDLNRDPISGTPGAHPLGTGAGAASGAMAGALVGTALGPVGAVLAFTAHHVVAAAVDPELVAAELPAGDFSAPMGRPS